MYIRGLIARNSAELADWLLLSSLKSPNMVTTSLQRGQLSSFGLNGQISRDTMCDMKFIPILIFSSIEASCLLN